MERVEGRGGKSWGWGWYGFSVGETVSSEGTVGQNSQEYIWEYWATRSSVRLFARTNHSFPCSRLLASLAPSAALTRSLARSLRSLPRSWESEILMSQNDLVLSHSASLSSSSSLSSSPAHVRQARRPFVLT